MVPFVDVLSHTLLIINRPCVVTKRVLVHRGPCRTSTHRGCRTLSPLWFVCSLRLLVFVLYRCGLCNVRVVLKSASIVVAGVTMVVHMPFRWWGSGVSSVVVMGSTVDVTTYERAGEFVSKCMVSVAWLYPLCRGPGTFVHRFQFHLQYFFLSHFTCLVFVFVSS